MTIKKIIVVDDELEIITPLMMVIRRMGHDVSAAKDGSEALDLIIKSEEERKLYDLLLTDIMMPKMTGLELLEILESAQISIPTLVLTGVGDKELVVKLMQLGCLDFIDKPFTPEQITKKILELIEKTDEKREQDKRSKKLVEIGNRARVVAHDVKNMISATISLTDMVLENESKDGVVAEYCNDIINASSKAYEMISTLMVQGSENTQHEPICINVDDLIKDSFPIYSSIVLSPSELYTELNAKGARVRCKESQFQRIIINLVTNSTDSMVSGGNILIKTNLKDSNVHVEVHDEGQGIPEIYRQKVFEDGFTTKEKGHGIGLACISKAIDELGGELKLVRTSSEGTVFRLIFPICK